MSTTTTAHFSWTVENTVGTIYYTVKSRLAGTAIWTQFNTTGATTSAAIPALAINRIYDFQVVNVNNNDNPASAISQGINITDPGPAISPINVSVSYTFSNLSVDMTSYVASIATQANPGDIIATHELPATSTITDTFTGLSALTTYILTIIPTAGAFYKTFIYTFTTTASANCPAPQGVTATII